jgi:tetratricopeptide (TPR) repeat protein
MSGKFFILIFTLSIFSVSEAQIPDKFTNLQVLPKDISKDKLLDVMKSFTSGLGVRCVFCHEGEEGQPLSEFNFSSDIKTAKQKARIMMNMTHDINTKYLSALSEYSKNILEVKCITCHRGADEPKALEDVLFSKIKRESLAEAISTYDDLYNRYYGGFAYDFRNHSLMALVQKLNEEKMYDEALAFAKINLEKYPDSGVAYLGLAETYELKGDKENAINYYRKTLEMMPGGKDFINKKLEKLTK